MKLPINNTFTTSLALAISLLAVSTVSIAEHHGDKGDAAPSEASTSFNLSELTCWDVMTLENADRDTVLFLFYGYVSGVKGELEHNGEAMQKILSQLDKHCSENPDDLILELMTKDG